MSRRPISLLNKLVVGPIAISGNGPTHLTFRGNAMLSGKSPGAGTLALTAEFQHVLGSFYLLWSSFEFIVDFAIWRFLKLEPTVAHLMTAGLDFNRKARLLRGVIKRSGHTKTAQLQTALNEIQNESKRNVFAHSFWMATPTTVTFIERSRHGPMEIKQHTFTLEEFRSHVLRIEKACSDFEEALAVPREDILDFVRALGVKEIR
jgi:hypothetical protein